MEASLPSQGQLFMNKVRHALDNTSKDSIPWWPKLLFEPVDEQPRTIFVRYVYISIYTVPPPHTKAQQQQKITKII